MNIIFSLDLEFMHGIPFHQFYGAMVSQCLCYYDIELFFLLNPEFKAN